MNSIRKILIICVNYNTNRETLEYINSINISVKNKEGFKCEIFVVDNSEHKTDFLFENLSSEINIKVVNSEINRGYFGAIDWCIQYEKIDLKNYDFVITSNVDIAIKEDFFSILLNQEHPKNIGIIAPSIYSLGENKDRNPKIINDLGRKDMLKYKMLYEIPYLYAFYYKFIYPKKSKIRPLLLNQYIYAAHGSFIVFCSSYFNLGGDLHYPCFLFGEEIYFAERLKKYHLKTFYFENLKVEDKDHASTSLIKANKRRKYNLEAINYLIKTFFKNE